MTTYIVNNLKEINLNKDDLKLTKKILSSIENDVDIWAKKNKKLKTFEKISLNILYSTSKNNQNILFKTFCDHKLNKDEDLQLSLLRANLDYSVKKHIEKLNRSIEIEIFINTDINHKKKSSKSDTQKLDVLPIKPKYKLSQMILDEKISKEIDKILVLIKNSDIIYKEWGFEEVDPVRKSVINFYGAPGTGKTMAAHAIAAELAMDILPLNYADIESKFVGDAPKNLMSAFEIAKEHDALLFFDEADSFLGKRITNVSSSSDQAVNSLRSQMLILLESHPGIVIFATNLQENYDTAFKSRMLKSLQFELPNKEQRVSLIKKMTPSKLPIINREEFDQAIEELADLTEGLSGREIKNLILDTLIHGLCSKVYISKDIFIDNFKKQKEVNKKTEKEKPLSDKKRLETRIKAGMARAMRAKVIKEKRSSNRRYL